jgi:hypothetical protein
MPALWAIVQSTCSVICCCAPIYKSILPKWGLFKRLKAFTFPSTTGSSSAEKLHSTPSSNRTWPRAGQFTALEKSGARVSFSTPAPSAEPVVENFSWLQLDDGNPISAMPRAAVWVQASSQTESEWRRERVHELNGISVQRTVEVV